MPKKTNHAYSTTTSGASVSLACAFTRGALALVLVVALASLGFGARGGNATEESYIPPLAKDYINS